MVVSILGGAGAGGDLKTRDGRQLAADLIGDAVGEVGLVRLAEVLEGEHRDAPEPGLASRLPAPGPGPREEDAEADQDAETQQREPSQARSGHGAAPWVAVVRGSGMRMADRRARGMGSALEANRSVVTRAAARAPV